jgi:hypothetical protein
VQAGSGFLIEACEYISAGREFGVVNDGERGDEWLSSEVRKNSVVNDAKEVMASAGGRRMKLPLVGERANGSAVQQECWCCERWRNKRRRVRVVVEEKREGKSS